MWSSTNPCPSGRLPTAYIESLRLIGSSDDLEVLIRRTLSCPRDLPSFYSFTALNPTVKPPSHARDSLVVRSHLLSSHHLLTEIKRNANGSMATILLEQCDKLVGDACESWETLLMTAYICFLRLNGSVDDLATNSTWRYSRKENAEVNTILNALVQLYWKAGSNVRRDNSILSPSCWSDDARTIQALREVISLCQNRFTSISSKYRRDSNT
jgi:hypothetical protein